MIDYMKKFRLDKKIAFVIGGLGLIGKEITIAIASAGAKVIILDLGKNADIFSQEKLKTTNFDIEFREFDCSIIKGLEKRISDLIDEFGCPDIFINCSYPRTKDWHENSFSDITIDSFRENVDIHMNSFAWLARLIAEKMVQKNKSGNIIQLGSIYGQVGQDLNIYEGTEMKENMTYSLIKGGIINLTRQMASYYGKNNIRVNTLCPGGLNGHVAGTEEGQNQIFIEQYSKKVPLKRLGNPEEVASATLFLASDAASYITGTTMMIDGGWTII